jgi:hypothetical protein
MARPEQTHGGIRRHAVGRAVFATGLILAAPAALALAHLSHIRSSNIRVGGGEQGSNAPIGCGKRDALAGGFENPDFSPSSSELFLYGFNPTGGGGGDLGQLPGGPSWRTTVRNRGAGSDGAGKLIAFAYCDPRPPALELRHASVSIPPRSKATGRVECPRGTTAVSGGFSDAFAGTQGKPDVFGYRSERAGRRGWRASTFNTGDSGSSRVIVFVNCDPRRPRLHERSRDIEVSPGDPESIIVRCRRHRVAWSAGFAGRVALPSEDGSFPYELRRTDRRTWQASAFAKRSPNTFTTEVYCGPSPSR